MIPFLPLGFAEPLVLLGLVSLPVLWWLLRLIPPRPRQINFPPTRLLFDITPKEETPSRTPWWLTLLRLTLAALVIFAAAGPLWNPPVATSAGKTPLLLLVDDGFPAAGTWDMRARTADEILARAESDGRGAAVVPLSEPGRDISLQPAGAARVRLGQIKPKPQVVERMDMVAPLTRFLAATPDVEVIWLSDGVDFGKGGDFVTALTRLTDGKRVTVVESGVQPARALAGAENSAGALSVKVLRAAPGGAANGVVHALDLKGLPLGDAPFGFDGASLVTDAQLTVPVEIRNDVARLEISSERSAGAVQLLDKSWRRRAVGVVTGATADTAQPLLASTFYLSRALGPFADLRLAERVAPAQAVASFLDQRVPMVILADVGNVAGDVHDRLERWIDDGGVLVRFAGPRLAAADDDDLVPVKLRHGGRILGGSLSWEQPQQLAGFSREGPFNGMSVPGDVTVNRQVLAEPDAALNDRTWATLADGTPLVTAQRRGKGMIVLFHVTADTRWSNLPLSGTFVDMLKRIVAMAGQSTGESEGAARNEREAIAPTRVLDGFGVFEPPPATARPVPAGFSGRANADHPPGFYGPPEGLLAVNTLAPTDRLAALDSSGLRATREAYRVSEPRDLRGPILMTALALFALDALIVLWLAGGIARLLRPRRPVVASLILVLLGVGLLWPQPAGAQNPMTVTPGGRIEGIFKSFGVPDRLPVPAPTLAPLRVQNSTLDPGDDFAMKATSTTRLAYIITGNTEVDNISRAGLQGLTLFLAQHTALESGDPMGLDPDKDELSFFPLIYWPISPGAAKPSTEALQRIDNYMKQGGTILFDTRDAVEAVSGSANDGTGMLALRAILSSLDIPELEPVPRDHVLTKTFYLMRDFPGRFNTGQLWVEALPAAEGDEDARPARAGDGVSSILITSNDLAGAWAMRPDGQPMLPLVASEPRQREFAFRAGVNIVMYTLTGNYKADQVHIPALLERLGQ